MTKFEQTCYGMTEQNIRTDYMESFTARFSGLEMVVMGILSDVQHMEEFGMSKEQVRKQLNVAKFILSEMMAARTGRERIRTDSEVNLEEEELDNGDILLTQVNQHVYRK